MAKNMPGNVKSVDLGQETLNRLFFQDQQLQRLRGGAVKRTPGGQLQQSVRQGGLQRLSVHGEHFSLLSMSTVTVFL